MEEKKRSGKKELILSCLLILVLIISVFGLTYALFFYGKRGQVSNTLTTGGSITFTYVETSSGISLQNAMPISDKVGKSLDRSQDSNGYFDFNVSAKMAGTSRIGYEVYTVKQKVDEELNDEYVKVYLTDGTTDQPVAGYSNEVPTYHNLKQSINDPNAKQLYYGTFTSSGTQKFRLRMWVSEQYSVATVSEQFKVKVNVKAEDR